MQESEADFFLKLESSLAEEQRVREVIVEVVHGLEETARRIASILQAIHHQNIAKEASDICEKSRIHLEEVKVHYKKLSSKIPNGEYHKYSSHWQSISNKLCFLASLVVYLESGELATREVVMDMLGVKVDRKEGFHIDLVEYLCGLLTLANELSRLAVNSVIAGDYERPLSISKFISNLDSGFRLLNLKNDFLRKRYDGLKYDVKKIEQVVYDLRIRGLVPSSDKDSSKSDEVG